DRMAKETGSQDGMEGPTRHLEGLLALTRGDVERLGAERDDVLQRLAVTTAERDRLVQEAEALRSDLLVAREARMVQPPLIYKLIAEVSAALADAGGIAKDRKNVQQGYAFRGIDDVYNALASVLATHGLVILPVVEERAVVERQSAKGGALFYVTVRVRFTLVAAADGSRHDCVMYGEAMDSGDKATNKAMSAAFKYMAMEVFCIPTEGDNDADNTTHEVVPQKHGLNGAEVCKTELDRMTPAEQEVIRANANTILDLHNADMKQEASDHFYAID